MVEILAARQTQPTRNVRYPIFVSQGVNQHRLLLIAQVLEVDAQVFFYEFTGPLQHVVLKL